VFALDRLLQCHQEGHQPDAGALDKEGVGLEWDFPQKPATSSLYKGSIVEMVDFGTRRNVQTEADKVEKSNLRKLGRVQ
jgi:hypothetical protein